MPCLTIENAAAMVPAKKSFSLGAIIEFSNCGLRFGIDDLIPFCGQCKHWRYQQYNQGFYGSQSRHYDTRKGERMKTAVCLIALCYAAMAQDINGVSLGGTLAVPSIVNNHPSKAVLGWIVAALDSTGNVIRYEENINAIDLATGNTSIPAGSEFSMSQRRNQVKVGGKGMPQVASRRLDSILFVDGEVSGPDNYGHALTLFQSQLDSITAQDPQAALHAPLVWGHQKLVAMGVPMAAEKMKPHDFGSGYGPTLNYYIGEILEASTGYRIFFNDQDVSDTGTAVNPMPTDFTFTNSTGGTAVCGFDSPYSGYGVGGYDLGYELNCPASNWSLVSRWGSNRPDGQMDRIIQTGNVYNSGSGKLQNRDVMFEGCFPGDGGSIGTPIVVTSQWYGC